MRDFSVIINGFMALFLNESIDNFMSHFRYWVNDVPVTYVGSSFLHRALVEEVVLVFQRGKDILVYPLQDIISGKTRDSIRVLPKRAIESMWRDVVSSLYNS